MEAEEEEEEGEEEESSKVWHWAMSLAGKVGGMLTTCSQHISTTLLTPLHTAGAPADPSTPGEARELWSV